MTLAAGANGTKKLVERYGDRLICVRYRYDREKHLRLKTVELIEEEAPWLPPDALYLVKIDWEETELQARVKAAGATWDRERRRWRNEPRRSTRPETPPASHGRGREVSDYLQVDVDI